MPWPLNTYNNNQQINGVIVVDGIAAARSAMCPIGKTLMMDSTDSIFYIKTVEANSVSTIEAYRFEKIDQMDNTSVSDDHLRDLIREVLDESNSGQKTDNS